MATHRIPILGANTKPDNTGDVFFQPYSIVDLGASGPADFNIDPMVLTYNTSGNKDAVHGNFRVPANYQDNAVALVVWTGAGTTGDVIWEMDYLPRSGAEDMGAAAGSTGFNVTTAKSGTAFLREESSISLTSGDFVAGDEVLFRMNREGVTEGVTGMATPAVVFGIYFEYTDV